MKISKTMVTGILSLTMGLALLTNSARAQSPTNEPPVVPPGPGTPPPAGTVPVSPKVPTVVVVPTVPATPGVPDRPGPPAGSQPPAEVKDKVDAFKQARESFLAKQRELAGAKRQQLTEEQRQALIETIKANQQELRARIDEIKNEFRNRDIDTVIEDVKRSGGDGRPRRGED